MDTDELEMRFLLKKKKKTTFNGVLTQSLGTKNPFLHSHVIQFDACGSNI